MVTGQGKPDTDNTDFEAEAEHEIAEDRRIAGLMVEPRNREQLLRRAEVTERLLAQLRDARDENQRLRAESAEWQSDHADQVGWLTEAMDQRDAAVARLAAVRERCDQANRAHAAQSSPLLPYPSISTEHILAALDSEAVTPDA